jgi:hypothetical protein
MVVEFEPIIPYQTRAVVLLYMYTILLFKGSQSKSLELTTGFIRNYAISIDY